MARAHCILIHLGTVLCVLHRLLLSRPRVFGLFDSYWSLPGTLLPGPAPVFHPVIRDYFPSGRLHPMCIPHPAACYPVAPARGSFSCLMP